jgi:hypothetical protein
LDWGSAVGAVDFLYYGHGKSLNLLCVELNKFSTFY